jgi:hypothetical protein
MRLVLDESNYQQHNNMATKKSLPDRTKSAPHFDGVHRKVTNQLNELSIDLTRECVSFSVTFQAIFASIYRCVLIEYGGEKER